jgi:hypothetical protein
MVIMVLTLKIATAMKFLIEILGTPNYLLG